MEILELDLNELVSGQIKHKIEALEVEVEKYKNLAYHKGNQAAIFEAQLQKLADVESYGNKLADLLRSKFAEIPKSEKLQKYQYISRILFNLFGIESEYGYISDQCSLEAMLAVSFYKHKVVLCEFLRACVDSSSAMISFIEKFKMPYDFPKHQVMDFVKNLKYNTNGNFFCENQAFNLIYWVRGGGTLDNVPYDLIMKNPHILEDDVFEELLYSIRKFAINSNALYLLELPKYNKSISIEQIQRMGEILIEFGKDKILKKIASNFIEFNIKQLNAKTLDFLLDVSHSDNQYSSLHWSRFPNKYQMKFLKSKSFEDVFAIISKYDCKWSTEQKEQFLKEYFQS